MNALLALARNDLTQLASVEDLQHWLLEQPQADIQTEHVFKPGVYERRITIPAWTVLTGAQHRTDYRVRLEQGTIVVTTDEGPKTLHAPHEMYVKAGLQRAGRVLSEIVVWVDIYENPDDCTNLGVLEERCYVVPDCGLGENRMRIKRARADYALFLKQLGVDQAAMDAMVMIEHDLIPMPAGFQVELQASPINGQGLFALRDFAPGETVCPGRLAGKRTPAGRYINHSPEPNIVPVMLDEDIYAVARTVIRAGDEFTVNYRDSLRVNVGLIVGDVS